jgi:hypothetical protein
MMYIRNVMEAGNMVPSKIRKQIYLTPEQNEDLKTLAMMRGTSEAAIIREALSDYVTREKEKAAKQDPLAEIIGSGMSKYPDSVKRHDYYLYKDENK